jgi:cell wall-associated NlpC family hydrolase
MARVLSLVLLGIDKVSPALKKVDKNLDRIGDKVSKAAISGGLVAAAGAATQLTAALAPAAAAAGALPGAFAVAKAASITAKVAFQGMGEAMSAVAEGDAKALEEAMKKLAPNARAVAREGGAIVKTFKSIQGQVQQKMFAGIAPEMREVSGNLAPALRSGMSGVAVEMNKAGKQALAFGQTPLARGVLSDIFSTTQRVIKQATGAVQPFLTAMAKTVQVSLPFAQRLTAVGAGAAKSAAGFLSSKSGMDAMRDAIGRGVERLLTLGRIVKNVFSGIFNMFKQVRADGGSLLITIEQLTAKFAAWAKTSQGQKDVAEFFRFLSDTMKQVAALAPILLSPLVTIAKLIGGMPEPLRSFATGLLAVSLVFGPLAVKIWAVVSATVAFGKAVNKANIGTKIATAASKLWAGAIWLVNAAMRANPIGIVITVIMALVGAVVLAYQKSETFRAIVQAAWKGIQNAVSAAWNGFIKPAFTAIRNWIVNDLGPKFMWFHNSIVKPVWAAISFAIKVAWGIIKIIFAAIKMYVERVLAPIFMFLWKNVVVPVWNAISAVIKIAWGAIKIIFAAIKMYVERVLAPIFMFLWKNVVVPVWNAIKSVISAVWTGGIKPAFDNIKKGVDLVGRAFKSAADFIKKVWDKVKQHALTPVRFVVDTVYTKGIKAVWDRVASFVKADPLPAAPRFATGGQVNVGTTGKADDVMARLSRGEYVINAEATSRNLPLIDFINRRGKRKPILKEMGMAGDPSGQLPGFAEGGIVGWVKSFISKAKNGFLDGVINAANGVFNPLRGLIDGTLGTRGLPGLMGGVPKKYMGDFLAWLKSHRDKIEGGGGSQGAVKAARSQLGVPYSWGGGGPGGPSYGFAQGANIRGFDCSSLMQYSWYKATKKVMPRTTYTQWPWLNKISKPVPGALGFPHMGHVFMYSGNNRIIEAPYTGARVREVGVRPAKWGIPPASFMRADDGQARLSPGMNMVYNGTGGMEQLSNNPPIIIQHMTLAFSDDRDMYTKGREFAEGLRVYKARGGKIPTP